MGKLNTGQQRKKYLLLKVAFIDSQSGIYRKIERYTTHTLICNIFSVLIFFFILFPWRIVSYGSTENPSFWNNVCSLSIKLTRGLKLVCQRQSIYYFLNCFCSVNWINQYSLSTVFLPWIFFELSPSNTKLIRICRKFTRVQNICVFYFVKLKIFKILYIWDFSTILNCCWLDHTFLCPGILDLKC